ncbi:NADPH-dependent FMN reductase [Yinghuangia sp. YIM S09857]|uniref:NADPH-dependent FMN reductase n=1 Tax=Yinghuangia sp. YIM S09857 TaxID=3436929 RepID=UPI003F52F016
MPVETVPVSAETAHPQVAAQHVPDTPPPDPLRIAVIVGGARDGTSGPIVAEWFASRARKRAELDVDVLDLAQAWLPDQPHDRATVPAAVRDLGHWLAAADAFVLVTPEYNHSFPGAMKTAIDWFCAEWQAKPVGFVAYGGSACGLRAVDQLRLVFADLHAVTLADTVAFPDVGDCVLCESHHEAAEALLDRLTWWGEALRAARARRPYDTPCPAERAPEER